eukprot:TRINITY_DN3687_c0_g1_i1.p1 TRINITY_DN3687_c0_g1~~TRINITY_DN3687_c0_g1_i1.p1  ORF type:complete len:459 (-),score=109.52 TRINITY_DN3687_c0_g1_i1:8-1384(-)
MKRKDDLQVYTTEAKQLTKLVLPLVGSYLCSQLFSLVSILFVGHLGATELAAISLGSVYLNLTGHAILLGLMTAIDSLCAQAFGAQQYKKLGLILQRSLCITGLTAFLFVVPLWYFSPVLLRTFRQEYDVSDLAALYIQSNIIGLPAYIMYESLKRFMQAQSHVKPSTIISMLSVFVCIVLNYLFVIVLNFGFEGTGMATSMSYWFQLVCMLIAMKEYKLSETTWVPWSLECLRNWKEVLDLAIPGVLMMCAEWWGIELTSLLAGTLGMTSLAASSLMLNIINLVYMIPLSLSASITTRIGLTLGSGDHRGASAAASLAVLGIAGILSALASILLIMRLEIIHIFTDDTSIVGLASHAFPIMCCFLLVDGGQSVISGIFRGCSRHKMGAVANMIGYYLIAMPVGYHLAFNLRYGVIGLWLGLFIGSGCIFVSYIFFMLRINWETEAHAIKHHNVEFHA